MSEPISVKEFQVMGGKDGAGRTAIILTLEDDQNSWSFGWTDTAGVIELAGNLLQLSQSLPASDDCQSQLSEIRDRLNDYLNSLN